MVSNRREDYEEVRLQQYEDAQYEETRDCVGLRERDNGNMAHRVHSIQKAKVGMVIGLILLAHRGNNIKGNVAITLQIHGGENRFARLDDDLHKEQ